MSDVDRAWLVDWLKNATDDEVMAMLIEAWGTVGPLWHPKRTSTLVPKLKRILGDPEDLWLDAAIEAEAKNRREEALLYDPSQWLDC